MYRYVIENRNEMQCGTKGIYINHFVCVCVCEFFADHTVSGGVCVRECTRERERETGREQKLRVSARIDSDSHTFWLTLTRSPALGCVAPRCACLRRLFVYEEI